MGSKITADVDCSHEIKRCLLLRRKVMTNLDSILKSRDITLLAEVCLAKALVRIVCNFLGFVSSQEKFEVMDIKTLGISQLSDSITALCYSSVLFRK